MIENPISIVLLGNRPCVKARIANYILGYELLPVSVHLSGCSVLQGANPLLCLCCLGV